MNLHIVPDNVFINKFYDNLRELNLTENNRIVVRTNGNALKYLMHDFPFGRLYTRDFDRLTADTASFEKVFIHQFTPLLYRWVAQKQFQNLNWMVWGSDLYNLPFIDAGLYEKLTFDLFFQRNFSVKQFLYRAKVSLLHHRHHEIAYGKIKNVLTWMTSEYDFAIKNIPGLNANHAFFFYENEMPYHMLDELMLDAPESHQRDRPVFILGNSATPELNHLDAIAYMESQNVRADLWVPVSYGDQAYAHFLKKELPGKYHGGNVRFIDQYMSFQEYLRLLNNADGLIMNNIRPQGFGNILMMMYLGKKVFLNERNFSIPELNRGGLFWQPLDDLGTHKELNFKLNRNAVSNLLCHEILLRTYRELFS